MANPAQEQTMDEILASIRRIISDDEQRKPDVPAKPAAVAGNVSRLFAEPARRNDLASPAIAPPAAKPAGDALRAKPPLERPPLERPRADPANDHHITSQLDALRSRAAEVARSPRQIDEDLYVAAGPKEGRPGQALLSSQADAAVSAAFDQLASKVRSASEHNFEGLTEEMLRPMLRDWLEDNLPSLVERLVREEIERVSRIRR
jgi:cell pole-organizing protein PopZ